MKFDMHCHTKAGSIDSRIPIEEYIRLLKAHGFGGMLITDHDSYRGYRYYLENRDQMPGDFTVLMGVEYDTRDAGHFIVIMPDNVCLRVLQIRGMSVEMLEEIVHHFGGVLGPAHPFGARSSSAMFCNKMRKNPHFIQKFDFLEGFNTCETVIANQAAQLLARKYDRPCIGGSDSHKEAYIGMGFTVFDRPVTCNNDLIDCIRERGIAAFGGTERKFLRRHKTRNSFVATWGFKAFNRSLGFIYSPYRRFRLKELASHRR
ncbi:MAG: PHP-associated domain-containing protein [Emergencia sp.]